VERLHPDDNGMDQYSMGLMPEEETAFFEEHLLICDSCQERLAQNDAFIKAMQGAGALYAQKEGRQNPLRKAPVRVAGALAAGFLAVSVMTVWHMDRSPLQPVPVSLNADRGATVGAKAPAGREIALHFDMLGLPDLPSYELEIVDRWGGPVARVTAAPGSASVPALRAGRYYIRLYAPGGQLLREYGFEVLNRNR